MDGGERVDGVAMPPEIFAWVGECVENELPAASRRSASSRARSCIRRTGS